MELNIFADETYMDYEFICDDYDEFHDIIEKLNEYEHYKLVADIEVIPFNNKYSVFAVMRCDAIETLKSVMAEKHELNCKVHDINGKPVNISDTPNIFTYSAKAKTANDFEDDIPF